MNNNIDYTLQNFTITLYPFHLFNDEDEANSIAKNANDIWQNLAKIGTKLGLTELASLETSLISYQDNGQVIYGNPDKKEALFERLLDQKKLAKNQNTLKFAGENSEISGFIWPVRFHDTYTADLTLECPTIKVSELNKKLKPQECLLPNAVGASRGQTLLLYWQDTGANDQDLEKIATACVNALINDNSPQNSVKLRNRGRLLGSPIWEYDNLELSPDRHIHILVWPETRDDTNSWLQEKGLNMGEINYNLHNLLLARHKIISTSNSGEAWYREARKLAKEIDSTYQEFRQYESKKLGDEELKKVKELLKKILAKMQEYSQSVNILMELQNTIAINLYNYRFGLAQMQEYQCAEWGDDLKLWSDFLALAENQYQQQLKSYLEYTKPSLALFQQMINTIRGITEIEQLEFDRTAENDEKERDQYIQNTVFFWGTAVGFGGICAGSYGLIYNSEVKEDIVWPITIKLPINLHPFAESVIISSGLGIIAGLFVLFAVKPGLDKLCKYLKKNNNS